MADFRQLEVGAHAELPGARHLAKISREDRESYIDGKSDFAELMIKEAVAAAEHPAFD